MAPHFCKSSSKRLKSMVDRRTETLNTSSIARFFSPLAFSWLLMAVEGPISVSILSRLPDSKLNTAAFQVLFGLALFLESPVIDLLSTSTTLAKSRQSYVVIERFVIGLMFGVTIVHAAFVFSPFYDVVARNWLSLAPDVADSSKRGLQWMILWSACIGWRRFKQGVLIRNGATRWVGIGTLTRLATVIVVGFSLAAIGRLSGAEVVAIGLVSSVFAEAVFIHWASLRTIRAIDDETGAEPLSLGALAKFHFPLTATTMVMLGSQPLISRALAESPTPVLALAGYQVSMSIGWLFRATLYALPEVFITLGRNPDARPALRSFGWKAGLAASAGVLATSATGLDKFLFNEVFRVPHDVAQVASLAFVLSAALPLTAALQSYCRGMLTLHHKTTPRLVAMMIGVVTMILALQIGILQSWPGVVNALAASTIAQSVELAALYAIWRRFAMNEAAA